jgi:Ser/Thr protein kinase RdoA (MazF antagonist)
MTTTNVGRDALVQACGQVGIDASDAVLLKHHASSVYLLESANIVARVSRDADDQRRARNSVAVTQWLVDHDFPATAPADITGQPVDTTDNSTVTFWLYYPQDGRAVPTAGALGAMLRRLHDLPAPPVELQPYPPLQSLGRVVELSGSLDDPDREWLLHRRTEIVDQYSTLDSELGYGFCHGDAYPGNTLWGADGPLLGDWDEIAYGPRELDLANTYQGTRFGRSQAELDSFTQAYGYDVRNWSGFAVLREMRDLHTLASYIKLADSGDDKARTELQHRVGTLRRGDTAATWNAC